MMQNGAIAAEQGNGRLVLQQQWPAGGSYFRRYAKAASNAKRADLLNWIAFGTGFFLRPVILAYVFAALMAWAR